MEAARPKGVAARPLTTPAYYTNIHSHPTDRAAARPQYRITLLPYCLTAFNTAVPTALLPVRYYRGTLARSSLTSVPWYLTALPYYPTT